MVIVSNIVNCNCPDFGMALETLLLYATSVYPLTGILCFVSALYLWYSCYYAPYRYFKELGVPGPSPLPVLGNLLYIAKFKGSSLAFYRHFLKAYGSISGLYYGKFPILIVSDPEFLKQIMIKDSNSFVDRFDRGITIGSVIDGKSYHTLIFAKGESWRKRRRLLTPAFTSNKLRLMVPLFHESIETLIARLAKRAEQGEETEAIELYTKFALEVLFSVGFGIVLDIQKGKGGRIYKAALDIAGQSEESYYGDDEDSRIVLLDAAMVAFSPLSFVMAHALHYSEVQKSSDYIVDVAQEMIRKRKEERKDPEYKRRVDILQLVMDAAESEAVEGWTDADIAIECLTFLGAGSDTTAVTLTFATYSLAVNPEVQERLANEIHDYFEKNADAPLYDAAQDIAYMEMVVQETLRMYPIGVLSGRVCTEDCFVGDLFLKKGVQILIQIFSIHHNPEVWSDPEKFDPDRFTPEAKAKRHPCAYLPFGHGPRNCIGWRMGMLEMKMTLLAIVQKYKILPTPETEIPLEIKHGITLAPKHPVKLRFEPR